MRQEDLRIDFSSFMDELSKIARSGRGLMSDFMGGVDPTGTSTFQYGMQDAKNGGPSGVRRAVGAVGGVVGGAAVIPAAVGGTVGAIKGFAATRGGIGKRLIGAGSSMLSGAVKPYTSLYHGMRGKGALAAHRAGRNLTKGQAGSLQKLVKGHVPLGASGGLNPAETQGLLRRMSREQIEGAQRKLTGEIAGGAGALGLSGAISGGSAYMQYGKGAKTQQSVNRQLAARRTTR